MLSINMIRHSQVHLFPYRKMLNQYEFVYDRIRISMIQETIKWTIYINIDINNLWLNILNIKGFLGYILKLF